MSPLQPWSELVSEWSNEFGVSVLTRKVEKENPPKIGYTEDPRGQYDIEVCFLVGGERVGKSVRFPAEKTITPQMIFAAAIRTALAE